MVINACHSITDQVYSEAILYHIHVRAAMRDFWHNAKCIFRLCELIKLHLMADNNIFNVKEEKTFVFMNLYMFSV